MARLGRAVAPDMERILGQATICRKMAEKWIEIAQETQNPAAKMLLEGRRCDIEPWQRCTSIIATGPAVM